MAEAHLRRYLTTGEVARQLRISTGTVRRAALAGQLRYRLRTPGGHYRFDPAEVARFASELGTP